MALASPEIDVLGLSIVAGNVPLHDTVVNACKLVGLMSGRRGVPKSMPALSGPLVREQVLGKYARIGAFDDALVKAGGIAMPEEENAVQFIVRTARAAVYAQANRSPSAPSGR
jgi:purine nucleosidase